MNILNRRNSVLYPKLNISIKKNFRTYIFEANPFLCEDIKNATSYIKQHTKLVNITIFCPVIVSSYDGIGSMAIDEHDVSSSKYYENNNTFNDKRKKYTLPVINITKFIINNIHQNDFNAMKFDIEGEENYIIPQLMKSNALKRFDILYSEFHIKKKNNPLQLQSVNIFNNYIKYTKKYRLQTFEEKRMPKNRRSEYLDLYYELFKCRKRIFN